MRKKKNDHPRRLKLTNNNIFRYEYHRNIIISIHLAAFGWLHNVAVISSCWKPH